MPENSLLSDILAILRWIKEDIPQNTEIVLGSVSLLLAIYFIPRLVDREFVINPSGISTKDVELNWMQKGLSLIMFIILILSSFLFWTHNYNKSSTER